MKTIALSRGLEAVVDDEDFEFLSQWKWSALKTKAGFYACRMERKAEAVGRKPKMLLMHRVVARAPSGKVVDHQNRSTLDNRRNNLVVCTQRENMMNSDGHRDRVSRFKGVSPYRGKWTAYCRGRYLGVFASEEAAAAAYGRAV